MNTQDQDNELLELVPPTPRSTSGATAPHNDTNLAPIFKLDHDILLQIFQINANMDQDCFLWDSDPITAETARALNDTRNSSQVNSRWRNLIVDAPILWANLIDIQYLNRSNDWWRKEVFCRTKGSTLHVKGRVCVALGDNLEPEPWWTSFLTDNWPRTRKIDLEVQVGPREGHDVLAASVDYTSAGVFRKVLPFLSRSTSALESLFLSATCVCDPFEPGSTFFNNCAPQLTRFELHNVAFTPPSSWLRLPQLRRLYIKESRGQTFHSGDQLCEALSQMPNLEFLYLEDAITNLSISRQTSIYLPRLEYLSIRRRSRGNNNPSTYWPLLDRIIASPGCSIELRIFPSHVGHLDVSILARLAKNYFQVNQPTKLVILYDGRGWFKFADRTGADSTGQINEAPLFDFSAFVMPLAWIALPDSDRIICKAFEAFFGLSFTRITELHLELGPPFRNTLLPAHQLQELLCTFNSVETLATTPATLSFLLETMSVNISALFPKLKILKMSAEGFEQDAPFWTDAVQLFLSLRQEAALPVSTLEYQSSSLDDSLDDLSYLEDFVGLRVVWTTKTIGDGEYICGTGKPEELDLARKKISIFGEDSSAWLGSTFIDWTPP